MLGNPPWERIKLQEQEFFATKAPEIATARNKAERQRLIKALRATDATPAQQVLFTSFLQAKRQAEVASLFVRRSGRFPLTAVGDVNIYALFAELCRHLQSNSGRSGCIVPSGIATDDSTKAFFQEISSKRQLVSLFDFENRHGLFAGVHRSYKFSLMTLGSDVSETTFVCFATDTEHLADTRRRFTLSPADMRR